MSLELRRWMDSVSGEGWRWYVKRLSGNDTLANGTHQAGPYISKAVGFKLFPRVHASDEENPRARFAAIIDSHGTEVSPTLIWYNNKLTGGTRDECRFTNWGGGASPILDPEATGSICIFAFYQANADRNAELCRVWLCDSTEEEDTAEDRVGPVEPGRAFLYDASGQTLYPLEVKPADASCQLTPEEMPNEWRYNFPEASEIVAFSVGRLPSARNQPPDERLLRRRVCEYELFRSVESVVVTPRIREGFATVDLFVDYANSVTNRRKARSGASLELHAKTIFDEESLPHSYNEQSEHGKRPDFLFPSAEKYRDFDYPPEKLRMLGVKTTCKDRWRQILDEADRVPVKHLLTLQEGISLAQFAQMMQAKVRLVVPKPLHDRFHRDVRPHLLSLEEFIASSRRIGA